MRCGPNLRGYSEEISARLSAEKARTDGESNGAIIVLEVLGKIVNKIADAISLPVLGHWWVLPPTLAFHPRRPEQTHHLSRTFQQSQDETTRPYLS